MFVRRMSTLVALGIGVVACTAPGKQRSDDDDDDEQRQDDGAGGDSGAGGAGGTGGAGGRGEPPDNQGGQGGGAFLRRDAAVTSAPRDAGGGGGAPGADAGAREDAMSGAAGRDAGGSDTGGVVMAGGPSRCVGAGLPICLDFENGLGPGVTAMGAGVSVDKTRAYRGSSALRIKMTKQETNVIATNLPSNGGVIWGRYFLYATGSNKAHGSLVRLYGSGSYRMGMSAYRFMGVYNPGDLVSECNVFLHPDRCEPAENERALVPIERWTCVEWEMNAAAGQPTNVYRDGVRIGFKPYQNSWPKVTSFDRIDLGLAMYHAIDKPFDMWIDEVAVDTKRIGCDR